jgi:hypothetical protein
MKTLYLILLISAFLSIAPQAQAQQKRSLYTADQVRSIWQGIKEQCQTLAQAEGKDELYDKCLAYQKAEWKTWAHFYGDDSVSQAVWERCDFETGFRQTLDVHTYNQCIRLAKDRADLQ